MPREGRHPPRRTEDAGWLIVEWPARYAHWHEDLAPGLRQIGQELPRLLADWPRADGPVPRLLVCRDPAEAAAEYAARGLAGDPRVPRAFPALDLAIVPLPLDDAVLAAQPEPPQSWRRSLLHEAAHLLAARRPGLAHAPLWFHEGLAEAFSSGHVDAYFHAARWPLPVPDEGAAEDRLETWAHWTMDGFQRRGAEPPWEAVAALDTRAAEAAVAAHLAAAGSARGARRWRGRDAHADDDSGRYLAAPLAGQVVEVDLPALAPGASARYALRTGVTGLPDAGLLLWPASGAPWRLRCDSRGGLAAWREEPGAPPRNDATDRGGGAQEPGSEREIRLEHRGAELAVLASEGFLARIPLDPAARAYAVRPVLYARGGVFVALRRP